MSNYLSTIIKSSGYPQHIERKENNIGGTPSNKNKRGPERSNGFLDYLNSKRNLIILIMCINAFALAVNELQIKGSIPDSTCDYNSHNLLTSEFDGYETPETVESEFWPFTVFYEPNDVASYRCNSPNKKSFKGIFVNYDISEFIIYSILLILILYIKWDRKGRI